MSNQNNTPHSVLFVARRYPPSVGGMERFAYDLSCALEKEVSLTKITWGGSNKWLPLIIPYFFINAFFKLLTRKFDTIHCQDAVLAPIGWLLSKIFRRPYIVVAHGLDITYSKYGYQKLILPFVKKADRVISISSATKDEAERRGVVKEKSIAIFLGTHDDYGDQKGSRQDLAKILKKNNLENTTVLLTTGRLVKRKGVAWFIDEVLPELISRNNRILYVVAGEGSQRQEIEAKIKTKGLEKVVYMLGRVDDETRTNLYLSADIFVMPNIRVEGDMEGFGIVAHEAATARLPVVASNIEGIADAIVHEKNGILVKAGDKDAYIRQLTELIKNRSLRKKIGIEGRNYTLEKYNWHKIAQEYAEMYLEVMN